MTNVFTELWQVALDLIRYIHIAWDWLFTKLVIKIPIKIPLIMEDGFRWDTGITPIMLLSASLGGIILYWIIWGR